jgi:hypothetical protein
MVWLVDRFVGCTAGLDVLCMNFFLLEQFMLEDARNRSSVSDNTAPYIRRLTGSSNTAVRPSSAPVESNMADATLTIPLRRQTKPPDDKGKIDWFELFFLDVSDNALEVHFIR